ncbi:hypothetical protein FO519_010288 [Halicephalobus sp. NKZ332]|nr:hypothetical protein FO519_010288 [Halicephalobus sp. NKZ332]
MSGLIESLHSDSIHYIGAPGARAGYSGGPVINNFDSLSGILLGGIHGITTESTIQEVMDGFVEQKYVRILPLGVIEGVYTTAVSDNDS